MSMFADAGLPLIVAWPFTFLLLIPIIVIEVITANLPKEIAPSQKFWAIGIANVVSTIIGWPFAWLTMVLLQLFVIPGGQSPYGLNTTLGVIASVTLQSAWLIPYGARYLTWMVPAAVTFLLIPFFIVSIISEGWIVRFLLPKLETKQRQKSIWRANIWSYAFLIACSLSWLAYNLVFPQTLSR